MSILVNILFGLKECAWRIENPNKIIGYDDNVNRYITNVRMQVDYSHSIVAGGFAEIS